MRHLSLRYSLVPFAAVLSMTAPPATDTESTDTEPEVEADAAVILNDEGGPVTISGSVSYSNALFLDGVAEPAIILEDQAGFVDRDRSFVMSVPSQVLGQITSDFFTSPFTYSISLPIEPEASLRDVDHDGETEPGVMIYAAAYWTNTWGDPYLEQRDLYGGGWSNAYASTRTDPNPSAESEVIGGKYLIYSPDGEQSFPSGFGSDGLLFTDDDPIVDVPQGYSVVDLDAEPFTFDRSREATIDLIEGEAAALRDFSGLSYTEAFDGMIELFRTRYAFTELKGLDWDAMAAEFRPRFEEAEAAGDAQAYLVALRDFTWAIPDSHVGGGFAALDPLFAEETDGGLGIAIRELDDGRTIANFILDGGPAAEAGIELGAEILEIDGQSIVDVVSDTVPWSSPFSTDHVRRLQQLRYAVRFPVDTSVEVMFRNSPTDDAETATLTAVAERDSFAFSSFAAGLSGTELPVEYEILDSGYGYASIFGFSDNALLSIQLWERLMHTLNDNAVPGLIIDMRSNLGGDGFLAAQMAAYFFDEPLELTQIGTYDESLGEFYFDPALVEAFILPPENLRYHGPITVLVGPSCASACEFFAHDLTLQDRAAIVGQYPTAGAGGGIEVFLMPEDEAIQFPVARNVDMDGEILIEGTGVVPTVQVPVDEETLFSEGDPVLEAAEAALDEATAITIDDGGALAVGAVVTGALAPRTRVQYTLDVAAGETISIALGDETGEFDTVLRLYDVDGNLLAENDDAEETDTVNSALDGLEIPEDMVLIVEAGTFEDAGEGEYTLAVTAGATGEAPSGGASGSSVPESAPPSAPESAPASAPESAPASVPASAPQTTG